MKKVIVVMCIAVVTLALNFYTYAHAKNQENVIFYASYDENIDADFQ